MLVHTAVALTLSAAAGAFETSCTYLVEAVTERDGVTTVQPCTRWTDRAEAQRAAGSAFNTLVAQLRRDIGTDPDPIAVAALRPDASTLTVSWVVGEPGDETLGWRKSWRVVEDTTPRTVRAARPMSVHQLLLAAVSLIGVDSITVRGEVTEGSWLATDMDALDAILHPCGIVLDGPDQHVELGADDATIYGSLRWRVSPGLDAYEAPVALHLADNGRVIRTYADGSSSEAA
jgi:hypothetical protein